MKIEIHITKTDNSTDPKISITTRPHLHLLCEMKKLNEVITINIDHIHDTKLVINRDDPKLYDTGFNYHTNKITVRKIILDDFWELTPEFYTPKSVPDKEYLNHIEKVGGDWVQKALINNTTLFFNGYLEWDILYPVRRSFYKDVE